MSEMIADLLATSVPAVITWFFVSFFVAFLLSMACEPLRIPKRARLFFVLALVLIACRYLEAPWLLLPPIAMIAAGAYALIAASMAQDSVADADDSRSRGGLTERLRGEVAALRKTVANGTPTNTVELKRTTPQHGVISVSARW